jgi:hypothetical protein
VSAVAVPTVLGRLPARCFSLRKPGLAGSRTLAPAGASEIEQDLESRIAVWANEGGAGGDVIR